jgi:hypothetical protein
VDKIEKEDFDSSGSTAHIGKDDALAGHESSRGIRVARSVDLTRKLQGSLLSDFAWLVRNISVPELTAVSGLVMMCLYVYVHPFTLAIVPVAWIAYALYVDHKRSKKNPYRIQFNDGFKRRDVSPT